MEHIAVEGYSKECFYENASLIYKLSISTTLERINGSVRTHLRNGFKTPVYSYFGLV